MPAFAGKPSFETCVLLAATRLNRPGFTDFAQILRDGLSALLRMRGVPPRGGVARRKAQTFRFASEDARAPLGAPHARTAHAHLRRLADRQAPLSPEVPRLRSSHRFQPLSILRFVKRLGRSDRRRLAWALRSSASSWQGFLVSPGGAPPPPGCPVCETDPAGRRTHPASRRLMIAPLNG